MGCDTHLFLPPTVRQDDFCIVFAALLGHPAEKRAFGSSVGGGYSAHGSQIIEARPAHSTGYNVLIGVVNGQQVYSHWHWDAGSDYGFPGHRLVSCARHTHRLPLIHALADFFGGYVDDDDCDEVDCDYIARSNNLPYRPDATDGAAWCALQDAMLAVHPITLARPWDASRA